MIAVGELEDIVPRIVASKPNLYVSRFQLPVHGDFLKALKRGRRYGPFVDFLWQGFTPEVVDSREAAKKRRRVLIKELEQQRFVVNPTPDRPHRVYVLELDRRKYPKANGSVVYVGETQYPIEKRIENHLAGIDSSPHVKRAFVKRRTDLEIDETYPSRVHATVAETALGKALQARGFVVAGPQGLEEKPRPPRG